MIPCGLCRGLQRTKYRDTAAPISEIAGELGVDGIVEGSVSRMGERLNIDAKLIRASDERRIWEEDYATPVKEAIFVESELAGDIGRQVGANHDRSERWYFAATIPIDPNTYDLYLQGKYHEKLFRKRRQ